MSCALQCSIEIPQINFGFFAAVVANGISRMDCHQRVMNEKKIPRGQFNLQSATTITTPKCKSTANIFHIKYFRSFLLTTGSAVFFLTELSVCVCVRLRLSHGCSKYNGKFRLLWIEKGGSRSVNEHTRFLSFYAIHWFLFQLKENLRNTHIISFVCLIGLMTFYGNFCCGFGCCLCLFVLIIISRDHKYDY